jgi:hypothetical protein
LLLVSLMPVGMDSSNRNDWLVDNSLKYSDLPSISMFLANIQSSLTVLLFVRVPYHFRCGHCLIDYSTIY